MVKNKTTTGDDGSNSLFGSPQGDHLIGLGGNDALSGFMGDDRLDGGDGNDWLDGGEGKDRIDGGNGSDWVNYGRDLNDPNASGSHGVVVNLTTGKATDNWGNADTLISIENAIGSNLDDTIIGNSQNNNIIGNAGNDQIYGRAGDDWLIGWTGNDIIYGEAGADWIEGGQGSDLINGGDGSDWVNYTNEDSDNKNITGKGITVDILNGSVIDNWGDHDTLMNVENIIGSRFKDTILGDAKSNSLSGDKGDDLIKGLAGNDFLFGGEGNDNLLGGEGDDFLQGDQGSDFIDGSVGNDWVCYGSKSPNAENKITGVELNLLIGVATDNWGAQDRIQNIEHVIGSKFNDIVSGDNNNNCLLGGDGDDIINGNFGDDWLIGENGDDAIYGGSGNDWLDGGLGKDRLIGGEGADFFVFSPILDPDRINSPDVITDFKSGLDVIILTSMDANSLILGDQAFVFSDRPNTIGTIWFSNGTVYGDTDGNGADFAIIVSGVPDLKSSDFLL